MSDIWDKIRDFVRNHKAVFMYVLPGAIVILLFLFFMRDCSGNASQVSPTVNTPLGGGVAALLIAAFVFYIADRLSDNKKVSGWLVILGIAMILFWFVPRFMGIFKSVTGVEFGLIALLTLGLLFWIKKSGTGKFGWKVWVVALFTAALIGSGFSVVTKGISDFWDEAVKSLPAGMQQSVGKIGTSVEKKFENFAAKSDANSKRGDVLTRREIEKSRRLFIENNTKLYTPCASSTCPGLNYDYSKNKDKHVEVITLGKTGVSKGVEVTLVKLPEAGTKSFVNGVEAFVETALLMTKSEAYGSTLQTDDWSESLKGLISLAMRHWVITLIVVLLLMFAMGGKGKKLPIKKLAVWCVVLFVTLGVILVLAEELGGINLSRALSNAIHSRTAPRSTAVVSNPEVRIDLVPGMFARGQKFSTLALPTARYKKIVLTERIEVRSTGTKNVDKIFMCFGAKKEGHARLKQSVGYYDVKGSYSRGVFMSLPKGTIIEFGPGEDNVIWFTASGGKRVIFDRTGADPIVFAYKQAT